MSRDQRIRDNWALLYASELSRGNRRPLAVIFCLVPKFLGATTRQYGFMLKGLREVERDLSARGIPFFLLNGQPGSALPRFVERHRVGVLVCDFSPLRIAREWKEAVAEKIEAPLVEVDAHNIIPAWLVSQKQEYGARTLRPKIEGRLPEFLEEFPRLGRQPCFWRGQMPSVNWEKAERTLTIDRSVPEVDWIVPGELAARRALDRFIRGKLAGYDEGRNDPNAHGQSDLSPYLHFGHLSAQRVALEVAKVSRHPRSRDAFLEELVVRRELSDNFCLYNPRYDSCDGFPAWARKTLDRHRRDRRARVCSREEFDMARTHDELWNTAQQEMVLRGKMHGYLRMYWAKKILEWSASPEEAIATALSLNDRYELDGRDPNGYAGVAWSIGGVHDRPWFERPVFGSVRYMSAGGCRAKFDVGEYIAWVSSLSNSPPALRRRPGGDCTQGRPSEPRSPRRYNRS
jgi:deoxyribodipyrimidine photo-lyase